MHYVCSVIFNSAESEVLLVKKTKPAWQHGLLNFPGGGVERGEQILLATYRENNEELDWVAATRSRICAPEKSNPFHHFLTLNTAQARVDFSVFKLLGLFEDFPFRSPGPETIHPTRLDRLKVAPNFPKFVPNLPWICQLALLALRDGGHFTVIEPGHIHP